MRRLSREEFIEKCFLKHGQRYNYEKSIYINNDTSLLVTCVDHGDFDIIPNNHLKGSGCPKCNLKNKVVDTASCLEKMNRVHNFKYQYPEFSFISSRAKINIFCPIHNYTFSQRTSAHLDGQGCKFCKNEKIGKRLVDTRSDFISKAQIVHQQKYDYSKIKYVNDKQKVSIICPIHGDFEQTPSHHKKGCGCPKCGLSSPKRRSTLTDFIIKAKHVHGDTFDYSKSSYTHSHDYVSIKCNICEKEFVQLAYSHVNIGNGCPHCLSSKREFEVKQFLTEELGLHIVNNSRTIIPPKEIDIYIPEKNIGIEYDGMYHHSELMGTDKQYHINKTEECALKNIQLIHVFESEWKHKKEHVKSILRNKLGKTSKKIFARKCHIKEISVKEKNDFLETNHIQGKDQSKIKLGLFHDDILVCVMTFGTPRYNKAYEWELIRFAGLLNTSIIGGAGKLFNHFTKTYNPKSVISYADRRYSVGRLYDNLGFQFINNSAPRYWYMKKNNYLDIFHRSNFTKKRIKRMYPEVDLNKDEWTLMQELGYNRIWDCGTKVYVWTNPIRL